MKRVHVYPGTKRSIVASILDGTYTIEKAAFILRVTPATIKRYLQKYGAEHLSKEVSNDEM